MHARMNRKLDRSDNTSDDTDDTQPPVPTTAKFNNYIVRNDTDPFPDRALLDPIDSEQHDDIVQEVTEMSGVAVDNSFRPNKCFDFSSSSLRTSTISVRRSRLAHRPSFYHSKYSSIATPSRLDSACATTPKCRAVFWRNFSTSSSNTAWHIPAHSHSGPAPPISYKSWFLRLSSHRRFTPSQRRLFQASVFHSKPWAWTD